MNRIRRESWLAVSLALFIGACVVPTRATGIRETNSQAVTLPQRVGHHARVTTINFQSLGGWMSGALAALGWWVAHRGRQRARKATWLWRGATDRMIHAIEMAKRDSSGGPGSALHVVRNIAQARPDDALTRLIDQRVQQLT